MLNLKEINRIQESQVAAGSPEAGHKELDPGYVRVAGQLRAFSLIGARVILFSPVGELDNTADVVKGVAEALRVLASAPVLVMSVTGAISAGSQFAEPMKAKAHTASGSSLHLNPHRELDPVTHVDAMREGESLPGLINRARTQYGYVLIDAPPVLASASTVLAAALADAVVFIVKKGRSTQSEIELSRQQFCGVGTRIAGFIFAS